MDAGFEASDDLSPLEVAGGGKFFLIRLPRDVSISFRQYWGIMSLLANFLSVVLLCKSRTSFVAHDDTVVLLAYCQDVDSLGSSLTTLHYYLFVFLSFCNQIDVNILQGKKFELKNAGTEECSVNVSHESKQFNIRLEHENIPGYCNTVRPIIKNSLGDSS